MSCYPPPPQEWVTLPDLTVARTEHGLAVVNGIPTVVGGVAAQEFLASVEQLDSSNDQAGNTLPETGTKKGLLKKETSKVPKFACFLKDHFY